MTERLRQFIEYLDISIRQFESKIGASQSVISRAIKQNSDIQSRWISEIAENYPHLNVEWLLTGKGEMIKREESWVTKNIVSEPRVPYVKLDNKNISADDERRMLVESMNKMADTVDRNSRVMEKLVELLCKYDISIPDDVKKGASAGEKRRKLGEGREDT